MAYSDYGYRSSSASGPLTPYGRSSRVHRSTSVEAYKVRVYCGHLNSTSDFIIIDALKNTQSEDIVKQTVQKLQLGRISNFELAEAFCSGGQICKERRLEPTDNPVRIQLLWPKVTHHAVDAHRTEHKFFLRKKESDKKVGLWEEVKDTNSVDTFLSTFMQQPEKEYPDLCNLPDLNETTLLDNIKHRFKNGNIYTYIGSILIAVNPFRFYCIYNPKYVRMYQSKKLGELPPHIFAIADAAYHKMLQDRANQCIVISGESGSGKTESTNLLLSHLSALSQKGSFGGGIEQTILGAGPVLEAFGNAKTVHNNNSSRFGKFIQVNYRENGIVHGAVVEKYLLEKSRLVHQAYNERNYHVFYYLLVGCTESQKNKMSLTKPEDFHYLRQSECYTIEDTDGEVIDEKHEFDRLKQSMEMVGFSKDTQSRIYTVLASVLHLGNIEFNKKRHGGHHEAVQIQNQGTVRTISSLLKVKEATLVDALTKKKTQAGGETVVMSYDMNAAIATRDAMAKCLYGALFDWIVLQVNQALISKKDLADHKGNSIGVLDIFGFEDFGNNSFEQFCINYANEHLQYYFNQHIFKYEQEEYVKEGIMWKNIEFIDNTGCLDLFGKRPKGLLNLLDEECNFRSATNETMLSKFIAVHKNNEYYETPQMREDAFYIVHYAGKVKYEIQDFREKNSDLMRHDVMLVLKNSSLAFVRELVGYDPVAMLRWAIVRAFFRSYFAFIEAGRRFRDRGTAPRYGSNIRKHSQLNRAQHLAMSGNMSENARNKKTILVIEKCAAEDTDEDTDESPIHDYENVFPYLQDRRGSGLPDIFNGSHFTAEDYKVMKRASRVLQKSKSFKPKTRAIKQLRDLQRMKTLTGKTQLGPRSSKGKNKPPSVGAQFNYSLSKLMETLNQANPFFIRCIKSNQDKTPLHFDDSLVLRQLRYTGMLATVRIRQSGYNYRVTFQDFIQMYRILLPKGLVSSRIDIERFLLTLDLNTCNYQIGETKVFLREAEKMLLDNALHQAIMKKIINLQRWIKACVERKKFLKMRKASVLIQAQVRSFLAQKQLQNLKLKLYAAIMIQRFFRNFRERKELEKQSNAAVIIQKNERGRQARVRLKSLKEEKEIAEEEEREHQLSAERRLKELLEKEKELELQKLADMEMIMLHEHGNQTLDQDIGVILDEGFPEQLPFENDKEDVVSEEKTDKTISRSSSYVETHFGTDNSDVFTTEASNESETEKVRFETGVEPQSPTTSLDEQHDHLMDSGSDMVIPRISRDRGYSKESFESEFDLSFPESTFPRLKEVVDKQSNENVSEVSPIKVEVAEKSKLPEEETDEWGKLEVEFKLNSSHEFTEDMSKKIDVDIDSTVKEVDNVEYTTVQNMPVTPTELPDYQLNESVPIDNNQQFLMPTEAFSIGKERKHSSEMMAEIEAEIQRRGADFQNSNDGLVKDGETEKKNSMLSDLSIGAYIVGKDKTSISDELDDGYNDRKQQFEKYIVGKDRDAIHDNKEELTSSAKDRSSKYLVKNKQTETQVSFAKTETDRNEKATLRTNDIQGKSSQDVENTYVVGKDKTDGSPIVSKYKQHKKDTNSSKEKYVRKENKDIYIVERTKLDSLEDDTVTPFMRSEPSSVVTSDNTSEQNKPKYAEIVKIKNEPVISTKDSQSSQIASTTKKPQIVPTSVNKESKYDALIPQNSSSKKAQKKYGRQLESTEGLKKTIMPSSSASELRTSESNSKYISGRRLSGSNIVEVVETRPFTSAGNLSRDMAGRRGLKSGRQGAQSKVASEELLRGQEEEFTSAQRRHHSEDIDLQEELDSGDFSQSQPNLKVSKPQTYLASPQIQKERKERRHSDILHMKENNNKGMLPGEAMDDVYDGSAVVKHRRKFTDSDYTKATNRSSKVQSVHTVSTPHLRGQEGPRDLEIRIKPAKMVKSISDDHLLTADGPSNARLHHKHVAAPLAQQESLEAPIEEEKGIVTRHLAIENPNRISFVMPGEVEKPLLPGESQESLDHQVLSPLSRAKKHLRNFVAGETPRSRLLGSMNAHHSRTLPRSRAGSKDSGVGSIDMSPPEAYLDLSPHSLLTPPSLYGTGKFQVCKTLSTDSGRSMFDRSDSKRSAIPRGSLKGDRSLGEKSFESSSLSRRISGHGNIAGAIQDIVDTNYNIKKDPDFESSSLSMDKSWGKEDRAILSWESKTEVFQTLDLSVEEISRSPSIKKKTTQYGSIIQHSKASIKQLLRQQSKTRKKSNEPDAEDSDDSQGEDNVDSSHVKSPAAAPKEAWVETKQVSTTSKQQKNRRKGTKKRRASKSDMGGNTWTVAGTSKAKYPTKVLVKNPMEMQQLDNFMGHKIREYCKDGEQKQSVFDQVFQQSLKDFHNDLITSLSTSLQESRVEYKYNNLMCKFEEALRSNAKALGLAEETGDINMGINAFRGFLDEFQRKKVSKELPELPKIKKEKKKKDKEKELIEINGHKYSPVQFSMHTVCEKCNSHVWMVEKGYVCQICHYTVHKKCSKESIVRCKGYIEPKSSHKGKVFSVPLASLVEVGRKIPLVIEKLLTAIETNGLYTTGIYRKAGGAGKVKQLVKDINSDVNSVDFSEEPVHALASLLKQFLRDLPEPLLTYNLYDDFIRGSEISDERERAHAMPEVLEKLPQPNYDLFERLVFHLAKIAQHESSNRMNPSALAIVFAPTILRSDKNLPAQESLSHVPKLSMCMQCIIEEQLRNILNMLVDIQTLDNATLTAEERLSTIRASNRQKKHESMGATAPSLEESMPEEDEEEEEKLLQEQIRSLQDEKEILTVQMPCLDWRASSSEDDLLSTDDYGSTGDEIDQIDRTDSAFAKEETMQFRQQNQQKATGSRKPHKKKRKGSGSDPIGETDPSDPKKRSTPSLKQIGEEEFF